MSRFVSAGTSDEPTKERDEAWLKAQQQIEAARLQTQQKPRPGEQEGGKSLYETLQANKAAKQEKFEEDAKLKNQFRSLDDDEVEFLDSVMESTRAKEAEVRKQTRYELDAFRRQQVDAEKAAAAAQGKEGEGEAEATRAETWVAGPRKRKKGREGLVRGVKVRRTSTAEKQERMNDASPIPEVASTQQAGSTSPPGPKGDEAGSPNPAPSAISEAMKPPTRPSPPKPAASTGLGLGAYSSDEDD